MFGTPHYMSPEQCAGTTVDHRTDIYALGVILYEMATGQVPFDADNLMGILTKHLYEKPIPPHELPPPVNVPPALEAVILKCLAKKAGAALPDDGTSCSPISRRSSQGSRPRPWSITSRATRTRARPSSDLGAQRARHVRHGPAADRRRRSRARGKLPLLIGAGVLVALARSGLRAHALGRGRGSTRGEARSGPT